MCPYWFGNSQILDAVVQGRSSVNEIALWPPLDHPFYRRIIENFAELKRQGQCIKVIGIDSCVDNNIDRDLWMTEIVAGAYGVCGFRL